MPALPPFPPSRPHGPMPSRPHGGSAAGHVPHASGPHGSLPFGRHEPRAPYRVCFVCTGNICRSPMAESVFRARIVEAGLDGLIEVDSAGTGGWHEGDGADWRTVSVLEAHGYDSTHTARQFQASWFSRLDLVIALDAGHLRALRRLAPAPADADKVRLLRSYELSASGDLDVPDPYYGGQDGFEECLDMVEAASEGLLDAVRAEVEGQAA